MREGEPDAAYRRAVPRPGRGRRGVSCGRAAGTRNTAALLPHAGSRFGAGEQVPAVLPASRAAGLRRWTDDRHRLPVGRWPARATARTIPIVMLGLGDPVGTGLVDSLARPGGNVTGQTFMASGLAAKRLELLKEAVPKISRVLVLSYLVDPIAAAQLKELEAAAASLRVKLLIENIRT